MDTDRLREYARVNDLRNRVIPADHGIFVVGSPCSKWDRCTQYDGHNGVCKRRVLHTDGSSHVRVREEGRS